MNAASSQSPAQTLTLPSTKVPSVLARAKTAVKAMVTLSRDSKRLDQVLALNVSVNLGTARRGVREVEKTEAGKALFAERPMIDTKHVDMDALRALPNGTLGREYVRFLDDNHITADAFLDVPDVGDERAAYLVMRMRQTHDLWHVITGYKPDVEGEVLLQSFTFGHTKAPSAGLISAIGTAIHFPTKPQHWKNLRRAYQRGVATRTLATFRWEDHWARPIAEVRAMLDCPAN